MSDLKQVFRQYILPEPAEYTMKSGNVRYLDSSNIKRPLTMPKAQWPILIFLVVVAAIIGFGILNSTVLESQRQAQASTAAIEQSIAAESSVNVLPSLGQVASMTDADIVAALGSSSPTLYNIAAAAGEEGVELYRFPTSISLEDGIALYKKGINGLTAKQAVSILAGGWYLAVTRDAGTTVIARYADFTSGTANSAIAQAMASQGIDASTITEEGTDDAGNTYKTGTATLACGVCTWRVSVLPLSEMYSISNLPENSYYVGIRIQA